MIEILLLIIACCLLFGADKTKEGIGCFFKVIAMIMIGLVIVGFIGSFFDSSTEESAVNQTKESVVSQQEAISFIDVTVDELSDEIEHYVDEARDKYLNQYVSITGRFDEINLIGALNEDFFYISDINDYYDVKNVTCYITSDEQYQRLKDFSENETITVKGKITEVDGWGYRLDVISID